jgi:protein-disulfide isomerase
MSPPRNKEHDAPKWVIGYHSFFWFTIISVAIAGLMIVFSQVGQTHRKFFTSGPRPTVPASQPAAGEPTSMGSINAPITIVEYEDFQCSICQTYSATTEKQLRTAYVDNGTARIVYKHRIV